MGTSGFLRLELRTPSDWVPVTALDLVSVATNALALASAGEPPEGFRFTQDDRYVSPLKLANPFDVRRMQRG
jgi:hypothetical protein